MDRAEIAFDKIKSHLLALQVIVNEEHIEHLRVTIDNDGYFDVSIDGASFYKTGDIFEYTMLKDAKSSVMEGLYNEV